MKSERLLGFLIGLALGVAIWLFSAPITGRREPWDAGGYYPGALLGSGFLGGLAAPGNRASVALGVFTGQVLVLIGGVLRDPGSGGLWPLGVIMLGVYSVLALAGAFIGGAVRRQKARHILNRDE